MDDRSKVLTWVFTGCVVVAIALAILLEPEPWVEVSGPPLDINKAAAETTQAAGRHFTKGVIEALKGGK